MPVQLHPVQEMVDSLAALLQLDVEVVDSGLNRICASERYRRYVGLPQERGYVSRHVIKTGKPMLVGQPGHEDICAPCDLKETCAYRSGMACPITHQGHVVGVVNLMGLSDHQRDTLHRNGDHLVKLISELSAGLAIPLMQGSGSQTQDTAPHITAGGCKHDPYVHLVSTGSKNDPFHGVVGHSEATRLTIAKARRLAQSNGVVLLSGETGAGKEVFSRAIHAASHRAAGPFVAVNCAAIPENLLESELFGYEDGAFTGARRGGKAGKFELAAGGTLLLDEIGEMPLSLQPKLLRVLEQKTVERVGGTSSQSVNARVIAASNRNLLDQVKKGQFRADLYYRLNVLTLQLPSLRERRQDIALLVNHFLAGLIRDQEVPPRRFGMVAMQAMEAYDWPGNVRELRNAVEYAAFMAEGPEITLADLPDQICGSGARSLQARLEAYERELLSAALIAAGRNVDGKREVAESLGISLPTLYRRMKELDLTS